MVVDVGADIFERVRCVVLSYKTESEKAAGNEKTLAFFGLRDGAGNLAQALAAFNRHGVNLTYIQSHADLAERGQYNFFCELQVLFHRGGERKRRCNRRNRLAGALFSVVKSALRWDVWGIPLSTVRSEHAGRLSAVGQRVTSPPLLRVPQGHAAGETIAGALEELRGSAVFVKILGSFSPRSAEIR